MSLSPLQQTVMLQLRRRLMPQTHQTTKKMGISRHEVPRQSHLIQPPKHRVLSSQGCLHLRSAVHRDLTSLVGAR